MCNKLMEEIIAKLTTDIEQSIQNALALFNSKDLGGGIDELYVIDDPIVSLHDPKKRDETSNSCKPEITENKPSPETDAETDGNQPFYDALPYTNTKMSQESVQLPFLENPIQHTIEEMQKVLNKKEDIFTPRVQSKPPLSPSQHEPQLSPSFTTTQPPEPSPEELLNLYSQDLGIILSPNMSPRGDFERNYIENEISKAKPVKKEKKIPKKTKQPKLNKEKKIDLKKGKSAKSEMMTNQDNRMRELMNIYGCGDKMKKLKSDSTLGSKSGVSRNASMKKLSSVNNISSKASSIAVSRKSKKVKYKFTNDLDINLSEGDLAPVEKSSRFTSSKRKIKQKTSNIKPIKKPNLKRKLVGKTSTDDVELKLSKSYQNPTRNRTFENNKSKNFSKELDDNHKGQKKQINPKPNNRKQKDFINSNRKALNINNNTDGFSRDFTTLDAIPSTKEHAPKGKSNFPEAQSEKPNIFLGKQSQVEGERNRNSLTKKASEERKLNKQVSLKEGIQYHNYKVENKETISDFGNEAVLVHPTQFHYTLPTQSSRSKEVERFLNGHYQHLPFVIGQSTNKSHNLWVNIQEALSLIKHNLPQTIEIQSMHDKDSERPLSVLSKLTTKSNKKVLPCPALTTDGLYDIPETSVDCEDGVKGWEDHPDCIQANLDPTFCRPRCSCLPQATLSYKKVLRQIFGGGEDSIDLNRAREEMAAEGGDNYTAELRKVLITFTQEFEDLNNKYEELLADPNSSKEELQRLEMYLETKEEEIREIIARINEVKELNDRSRGELAGRGSSLEPYKSTTSVQLWQTLRRVQQFKEDILSKPSGRQTSRVSCAKSVY